MGVTVFLKKERLKVEMQKEHLSLCVIISFIIILKSNDV